MDSFRPEIKALMCRPRNAYARAQIIREECAIQSIDSQINAALALISDLQKRREAHSLRSRRYAATLAPIHVLPSELLSEIFTWYHTLSQAVRNRRKRSYKSPQILCQICSTWRNVAIHTVALWKEINIQFSPRNPESAIKEAVMYFHRAGPAASTTVDVDGSRWAVSLDPLTRLILEHEDQIQTLVLDAFPPSFFNNLPITNVSASWSRLRKIRFSSNNFLTVDLRRMHLPWSQLTDLDFGHLLVSIDAAVSCVDVLACCSSLVNCSLFIWTLAEIAVTRTVVAPYTLLHLRSLKIRVEGTGLFSPLFDAFTLPSLQTLVLNCSHGAQWDHDAMMSFKDRSSLDLYHLELKSSPITSAEALDFLTDMPSLTDLSIQSCPNLHNEFLRGLEFQPFQARPMCPHLTSIVLVYYFSSIRSNFDGDALLRLVQSRCAPAPNVVARDRTYLGYFSAMFESVGTLMDLGANTRTGNANSDEIQAMVGKWKKLGLTAVLNWG